MGIKAIECINEARTLLGDTAGTTGTFYLVADLKKYHNEAQREIVKIDLQANATRESVTLTVGTKQTLPANSLGLIDVVRNMGTDGTTAGNVTRRITHQVMDELYPEWHTADGKKEVKFWMYDSRRSRDTFDVYPPIAASGTYYVEIIHGELPDTITDFDNTDILDDRYYADIIDYILFRAKSMHAEYAGAAGEAAAHLTKFETNVARKA